MLPVLPEKANPHLWQKLNCQHTAAWPKINLIQGIKRGIFCPQVRGLHLSSEWRSINERCLELKLGCVQEVDIKEGKNLSRGKNESLITHLHLHLCTHCWQFGLTKDWGDTTYFLTMRPQQMVEIWVQMKQHCCKGWHMSSQTKRCSVPLLELWENRRQGEA